MRTATLAILNGTWRSGTSSAGGGVPPGASSVTGPTDADDRHGRIFRAARVEAELPANDRLAVAITFGEVPVGDGDARAVGRVARC